MPHLCKGFCAETDLLYGVDMGQGDRCGGRLIDYERVWSAGWILHGQRGLILAGEWRFCLGLFLLFADNCLRMKVAVFSQCAQYEVRK
jgi:hypothetical protein